MKDQNTSPDICGTIHSSGKIDPFEGLDLNDICVPPTSPDRNLEETEAPPVSTKLFDLNPLDEVNLEGLSATVKSPLPDEPKKTLQTQIKDDINFIIVPEKKPKNQEKTEEPEKQPPLSPNQSLSNDIAHPPVIQKDYFVNPLLEKAYRYTELTQIREKIFASMETSDGNTLLIASPHDNTGSSLLTAALGYNTARSCQKKVLLIDCNMRRAGLHSFFNVEQSYGFTELIKNNLPWQAVTKETGIENLHVITAGTPYENLSEYLRYSNIPNLIKEVRNHFDLIIFDTSPILTPNRNNVNIVSLTSVIDYFLLITKKSGTTKDDLRETINVIEAGNGKINGIVLNEHTPEKKATPYLK